MKTEFHNLEFQKRRLLGGIAKNFGPEDQEKIAAALQFARKAHRGQRRAEGTAYIIHPVRVANTLVHDIGVWDADMVVAALLHDVIEDCAVRKDRIRKRFGRRVEIFVFALTQRRPSRAESEAAKELRKTHKLQQLMRQPLDVRIIKCADILDNLECSADVAWWKWTPLVRKKFPRWHREFQIAVELARNTHPWFFRKMRRHFRIFAVKRLARAAVSVGK